MIADNKKRTFNFLFFISCAISTLKTLFSDPRPYFVITEIEPTSYERYFEYGNPSGHNMIGFILISFYMENLLYNRKLYDNKYFKIDEKEVTDLWKIRLIHAGLVFLILFSRIYLGMHSLD